jgi:hypothetical protein
MSSCMECCCARRHRLRLVVLARINLSFSPMCVGRRRGTGCSIKEKRGTECGWKNICRCARLRLGVGAQRTSGGGIGRPGTSLIMSSFLSQQQPLGSGIRPSCVHKQSRISKPEGGYFLLQFSPFLYPFITRVF